MLELYATWDECRIGRKLWMMYEALSSWWVVHSKVFYLSPSFKHVLPSKLRYLWKTLLFWFLDKYNEQRQEVSVYPLWSGCGLLLVGSACSVPALCPPSRFEALPCLCARSYTCFVGGRWLTRCPAPRTCPVVVIGSTLLSMEIPPRDPNLTPDHRPSAEELARLHADRRSAVWVQHEPLDPSHLCHTVNRRLRSPVRQSNSNMPRSFLVKNHHNSRKWKHGKLKPKNEGKIFVLLSLLMPLK